MPTGKELSLELLSQQIHMAFEIIDRIDNEAIALRAVVEGLLMTHPDQQALLEALEVKREVFFSVALEFAIEDRKIEAIHGHIDRVIASVRARLSSGKTKAPSSRRR